MRKATVILAGFLDPDKEELGWVTVEGDAHNVLTIMNFGFRRTTVFVCDSKDL